MVPQARVSLLQSEHVAFVLAVSYKHSLHCSSDLLRWNQQGFNHIMNTEERSFQLA